MTANSGRPAQRGKSIEEVLQFSLSHWIRIHILIVLNEGSYTTRQIAEILGVATNNVHNHLREMLDGGAIEVVKKEEKGSAIRHWYRAVQVPYVSRAEAEAMTPQERQLISGILMQSAIAEAMAALWAGNLADPRACVLWDWFNVDEEGRIALENELERSWSRFVEVEVESTNRRAESGEESQSILLTQLGYLRARKARKFPESES